MAKVIYSNGSLRRRLIGSFYGAELLGYFMRIKLLIPRSSTVVIKTFFSHATHSLIFLITALALQVSATTRFENPLQDSNVQNEISGVTSIVQDTHGFIWLGGENGLGRYDGQIVKLFQSQQNDPYSLPSSYVWDLIVDGQGVMWIATADGLSHYDSATEKFKTFVGAGSLPFPRGTVSTIAIDVNDNLYAGTSSGLYRIDPARKNVSVFFPNPPIERSGTAEQLRDIKIAADGKIWIGTAGMGVAVFDPRNETFEYLLHRQGDANSLADNNIKAIEIDKTGKIWFGTYGAGVSVYDPETSSFRNYGYGVVAPDSLRSGVVWALFNDSEGTMWISLDQGGLARFDDVNGTFEHFLHDPHNPATISSNQLRAIYEDRNHDLWIGAFPSGLSYYNRSKQLFQTFHTRLSDPTSLSHNAVTSLFEDRAGIVWVGTEGGLNAFNPETGAFKQYRANPGDPQALLVDPILAIEEDAWGHLWVGTWAGGLHRFDREAELFKRYLPDEENVGDINCKFIWDIVEDDEKNLWIATETGGLNLYHRDTDSFSSFRNRPKDTNSIAGNFIWALHPAKDGKLWVGTLSGVSRLAADHKYFQQFPSGKKDGKSVSSNNIRSLYGDSRGLVWVGTLDRGVSIYDPVNQTFRYIDTQQGLPSATVSSLLEDDNGDMWLATANGLAHVAWPSMRVTVYGKEHGLAGDNFNRNASLKDRNGNLYFGSTEGLTVFHPDNLSKLTDKFPVQITGMRIFNREVKIGEESPLKTSIVEATEIRLAHSDIMFSVDFAALSYRNRSANRYAYKLDGFDRDWIYINTKTTATYTNIDPGTYTLQVKATSGNGVWNTKEPGLTIIVKPPPWRTWWAYLCYAIIVCAAFYFRSEHRRLRQRAETYRTQSLTDPLTRLYNREGIAQVSRGIFSSAETRKGTAVMLIDIDHFKRVNDRRGHDTGDLILTGVASLVLHNVRHGDHLGRWGGEEFVLICSNTTPGSAQVIAEKIRCATANYVFETEGAPVSITISIGVAVTRADETFEAALKRADVALYQAKSQGRNCVCLAETEPKNVSAKPAEV